MMTGITVRALPALSALLLFLWAPGAEVSAAPVLSIGSDPAAAPLKAGVRYRVLGGSGLGGAEEVWIGTVPLTTAANRATGQLTWTFPRNVSFTYDVSTGVLSTTVGSLTVPRTVGNLGALNYVEITITKNTPTTSVSFNSVALNGGASLGNTSISGTGATLRWKITGEDLTNGFTLTGQLNAVGLSGSGDSSFVQIEVGFLTPPDNEGPVTSDVAIQPQPVLLNGDATVTATVDDSTKGNSTVQSAEYQLNGGSWSAMSAQDGSFNSATEEVTATFTATQLGLNEVCVRGTDALGNMGNASCQTFLVTYKFSGFFDPIDNDFVNNVKAGQAVPAKWRLTDANDVPIADPASFVELASYPINCTTLSGDPNDSVEEYASGSSGLQYNGDGYWQFNWKTPKTYADTCRAMYVELDSGATSPVAKFRFKIK